MKDEFWEKGMKILKNFGLKDLPDDDLDDYETTRSSSSPSWLEKKTVVLSDHKTYSVIKAIPKSTNDELMIVDQFGRDTIVIVDFSMLVKDKATWQRVLDFLYGAAYATGYTAKVSNQELTHVFYREDARIKAADIRFLEKFGE